MKTITFYSYKGGVGRTLVLANIAQLLSLLNKTVVALDLDLEAPGLHHKFRFPHDGTRPLLGVVDYLHEFITTGIPPTDIATYMLRVAESQVVGASIRLIPAGAAPSPRYWQQLASLNWHELFYSPEGQGVMLMLDLKEKIEQQIAPDYLLIDARSGITELGGVATTLLPDQVVCLLSPNRESIEGARAVMRSIKVAQRLPGQEAVDIVVALTRIPPLDEARELAIIQESQASLNEEAENLSATLSIDDLFVLHSEPEARVAAALCSEEDLSSSDSTLTRDGNRLFKRLCGMTVKGLDTATSWNGWRNEISTQPRPIMRIT